MLELLVVALLILGVVLILQGVAMLTLGRNVVSRRRAGVSLILGLAVWIGLFLLIY